MQITTVDDGSQVIYVVVSFPHGWIIDEDLEKKFGITVSQGTNINEYYFCTDIESGEQVLFDAIEYNIDRMKEAIERAQLLSKFDYKSKNQESSLIIPKQDIKKKEEEINNKNEEDKNE